MAKSLVDDLINEAFGEACRRARQRKISKVQERITTREGAPVAAGGKTIRQSGKRKQDRLLTTVQKQQSAHSSAIDLRVENKCSAKRRKFNDKQRAEVLHMLEDVEQDRSVSNKMDHVAKLSGITQGMVSSWSKKRDEIFKGTADETLSNLFRKAQTKQTTSYWPLAEAQLFKEFKARRARRNRRVPKRWLVIQ
ncbi:hypothetical protein CYMTET_50569 [Cymbomonas tetramitiformis]|uniref:Uncharacterized protein n=1 Tax=Cymbomonas tetramitiformis TaxID=36881 RepID=A0AAE0BPH6_9CHLO|nr:hypothetical protein CYMTET_50569 [Cymbomonas tetramitiformis]